MNAVRTYMGQLVGGPVDGNVTTCESRKIPTTITTELVLDGGIKTQVVRGTYIWSEDKGAFLWNLETVTFPERAITE